MVDDHTGEILAVAAGLIAREDHQLTLRFRDGEVHIRLPTTRRIARSLGVPHYYVLPAIAGMEGEGILTREPRIGVYTTARGSGMLFSILEERYPAGLVSMTGPDLLGSLRRAMS
ncbi:MAG: hypothetical protein ACP5C4_02985 [Methanomicrobiales archaeon]